MMMSLRLADDPHCGRSPVLDPIEVGKADLVVIGLDGLACAVLFCVASRQSGGGNQLAHFQCFMFQSVWQSTDDKLRLSQWLSCPMSDIPDAPAGSLSRCPDSSSNIWSVFRYDRDKGLLLASARIVVNCRCYAVRVVNSVSVWVLPLGYGEVGNLPYLREPPVGREREREKSFAR